MKKLLLVLLTSSLFTSITHAHTSVKVVDIANIFEVHDGKLHILANKKTGKIYHIYTTNQIRFITYPLLVAGSCAMWLETRKMSARSGSSLVGLPVVLYLSWKAIKNVYKTFQETPEITDKLKSQEFKEKINNACLEQGYVKLDWDTLSSEYLDAIVI